MVGDVYNVISKNVSVGCAVAERKSFYSPRTLAVGDDGRLTIQAWDLLQVPSGVILHALASSPALELSLLVCTLRQARYVHLSHHIGIFMIDQRTFESHPAAGRKRESVFIIG